MTISKTPRQSVWRITMFTRSRNVALRNNLLCLITLVLTIGVICHSCVDAIVQTVETEEEQRIFRADYSRPAAYRLASPTSDQMESLHGLMRVMEVKNAKEGK